MYLNLQKELEIVVQKNMNVKVINAVKENVQRQAFLKNGWRDLGIGLDSLFNS